MELILWRHADAEPGADDLARPLTSKGRKQAARVAAGLRKHLPATFRVVSSPAKRALQTAQALGAPAQTSDLLAPGASAADLLRAAGWPGGDDGLVIVVGHQPTLGRVVARLLGGPDRDVSIQKGALWWIEGRDEAAKPARVRAVLGPDFL